MTLIVLYQQLTNCTHPLCFQIVLLFPFFGVYSFRCPNTLHCTDSVFLQSVRYSHTHHTSTHARTRDSCTNTLQPDQSSSSRLHVMNHNWSATKQRLHPQSITEISRHSVCQGTGFDNVGRRLGLAISFCIHQCYCSMQKRFSRDHCCREKSKPGCRIVGSHTRWELTTWADFQLCLHRLLM